MRTILSIALLLGLFISGFAQVADNVQEAARYRVNQDNISTLTNNNQFQSSEATSVELILPESRSNAQLNELGEGMWLKSSSQLNELGEGMWLKSSSQLNELGEGMWLKSSPRL